MDDLCTVSYTHLDVYKRQGLISKDGHVAIGAAIIADLILVAVYAL